MKISIANIMQALLIFSIGGWFAGVCVEASNADSSIFAAFVSPTSFQAALAACLGGSFCAVLMAWTARGKWAWLWSIVLAPVLMISISLTYFFLWPYDGHGRTGVHKTVMILLGTYWYRLLPVAIAVTTTTVAAIRAFWHDKGWRSSTGYLGVSAMCLLSVSVMLSMVERHRAQPESTPYSKQCCEAAYQVFVKKVGVSYAIHESEMYCEAPCTEISACLESCMQIKEDCLQESHQEDDACKQGHRECTWSCPTNVSN